MAVVNGRIKVESTDEVTDVNTNVEELATVKHVIQINEAVRLASSCSDICGRQTYSSCFKCRF